MRMKSMGSGHQKNVPPAARVGGQPGPADSAGVVAGTGGPGGTSPSPFAPVAAPVSAEPTTPPPAAAGDPISGDAPWCLLEFPWAPGETIIYCSSRDLLWRVRKAYRGQEHRVYLRAELEFIDRATEGQSAKETAKTFRRIDRMKARFGGWVVGTDAPMQGVQGDMREREAKLAAAGERAAKALAYFDREDVDEGDKRAWAGEFEKILEEVAELSV